MARNSSGFQLSRTHLFNAAGVGMIALSAVMVVNHSFTSRPDVPLCETRYKGGVLFSYTRQKGVALAPEELQAKLGGLDRGILNNARVVKDDSVPYGYALEVALKRAAAEEDDQSRSGIGFMWLPRQLAPATSACLSYSVWTPADFKPGDGGVLPGFVSDSGAETINLSDADQPAPSQPNADGEAPAPKLVPFSLRPQWRSNGMLTLWQTPNIGHRGLVLLNPERAQLKPGTWTRVEIEAHLNTPGQQDGFVRAWVDGKMAYEGFGVGFRTDEVQSFQAIIGDVHNMRNGVWSGSPQDTRIRISPLELRLK